jgi:hypothetical protein
MKRFLLSTFAVIAAAQAPQDAVLSHSVQVIGAIREGNEAKPSSIGGGIIIDAHHIMTTMGCCGQTKDGVAKFPVVRVGEDFSAAKLVWNGPGQLAIVEVEKELKAPPLSLALSKTFQAGQPVYFATVPAKGQPTISETTATSMAMPHGGEIQVIQMKAPAEQVDVGSGLFDACGNLIAINLFVDSGTQFAYVIDGFADGLQKTGIQVAVADKPCSGESKKTDSGGKADPGKKDPGKKDTSEPGGLRMPRGGEWVGVIVIIGLIALALRRSKQPAKVATTTIPDPPPYVPPVAPKISKGMLNGVAGQYSGASIPLETATVLGRDPHSANIVFGPESDAISKRHCSIRFDAGRGVFLLEDLGSTNGTFLMSGEKLVPGQPKELRSGQRFYLGDQKNQFEVGAE